MENWLILLFTSRVHRPPNPCISNTIWRLPLYFLIWGSHHSYSILPGTVFSLTEKNHVSCFVHHKTSIIVTWNLLLLEELSEKNIKGKVTKNIFSPLYINKANNSDWLHHLDQLWGFLYSVFHWEKTARLVFLGMMQSSFGFNQNLLQITISLKKKQYERKLPQMGTVHWFSSQI